MLQQFFRRSGLPRRSSRAQKGVALIFGLVLMLGIIIFVGLTIDSSNLFLAQRRLQQSVDAGVLAGVRLARQDLSEETLLAKVRNIVEFNVDRWGYDPDRLTYHTVEFEDEVIRVDASLERSLSLSPVAFSGVRSSSVRAVAAAAVGSVNIALVLDESASMNFSQGGMSRLQQLRQAVGALADTMSETQDRLSLATFSDTGQLLLPMNVSRGFDRVGLDNALSALSPVGHTNLTDGIFVSRLGIENLRALGLDEEIVMVLVTDGAPTAARIQLDPGAVGLLPPEVSPHGTYDYHINFGRTGLNPSDGTHSFFLAALYRTSVQVQYNHTPVEEQAIAENGWAPAVDPVDSSVVHLDVTKGVAGGCFFPGLDLEDIDPDLCVFDRTCENAVNPIDGTFGNICTVNSLNFIDPNGVVFEEVPLSFWGFAYLTYGRAIQEADFLRNTLAATIHTVGVGEEAPYEEDPYQFSNVLFRKSKPMLLERIALDPAASNYEFKYTDSYGTSLGKAGPTRVGSYTHVNNSADFSQVLEDILNSGVGNPLRLVE